METTQVNANDIAFAPPPMPAIYIDIGKVTYSAMAVTADRVRYCSTAETASEAVEGLAELMGDEYPSA